MGSARAGCSSVVVLASGRRHERVADARNRLDASLTTLIERGKADGDLRPDFDIADVGMIRAMIAGVVNATHKTEPDAWRRYFEIIVDGITTHPQPRQTGRRRRESNTSGKSACPGA